MLLLPVKCLQELLVIAVEALIFFVINEVHSA